MTIKSDPRLPAAKKKKLSHYFCQLEFPSRKSAKKRQSWWDPKEGRDDRGSANSHFVLLFWKPQREGETTCGKFQGHLSSLWHKKKTSSQHSNLYLESAGCVSSYTRLMRCFLGPFLYYSLIPRNYTVLHIYPQTDSTQKNRRWKTGSCKRRLFKFTDYWIQFQGIYCFFCDITHVTWDWVRSHSVLVLVQSLNPPRHPTPSYITCLSV